MEGSQELVYWFIWWGWWILQFVLYSLLALLMSDGIYQIIVSIRGFWNQKEMPRAKRYRRFVVLIPAHNEAQVISPLLKSLAEQNYPKNCYTVYVSCDNCQDNTAELARMNGAVALERFDKEHNGKTWNVRWALGQLPMEKADALAMFDADNLVDVNFLMNMNNYMELHPEAEAIQGVLDVKNPDDNWLTRSYALAYWFSNRFWQLARGLWGLSCTLGGTGLVIRAATLERIGWNLESLTEDLEMSTRLILSGSRVHWNDAAVIYDEKPQSMAISKRQRTRWMQGHYWVFWHYGMDALKSFFVTRKLQYLDLFLYLLAPAKSCLGIIIMIAGMAYTLINNMVLFPTVSGNTPQTMIDWVLFFGLPIFFIIAFCLICVIVGPSMHEKKFTLRYVKDTFAYFWFGLTWIPIIFKAAFLAKDQGTWVKTEHTRGISLEDVAKKQETKYKKDLQGDANIKTQFELLTVRRFLPLFLTQFFGAFNDNLFKNALVILITFRLADEYGLNAQMLITSIAGLFILPFFLFSSTAGQLADKYEKSFLIRIIKFVEIVLMVLTAASFTYLNLWGLVILLFFMGAQSAFFGPLKFSILPQHLKESELVAGNGLVSAGTYIAILSGTLCGGLFILHPAGRALISVGVVGVAVLGFISSLLIPKAEPSVPGMKIDRDPLRSTMNIISYVRPNPVVFRSILGISWFWFLGTVFLSQFPTFSKDILGGNEEVSTLFLVVFSVGVGLGSTLCNRLLKGKVSARLVPFGCIGMTAATVMLYFFSLTVPKTGYLIGLTEFISGPGSWGVIFSFLLLAASGGIFSVPMYALMQSRSSDEHRARVVACLNIIDSFGMVLSAVFVALMLMCKISIINIFLIIGIVNLLITPLLSRLARDEDVQ